MVGTTSPLLIGFIVEINRLPRDSVLLITLCGPHNQKRFRLFKGFRWCFKNVLGGLRGFQKRFHGFQGNFRVFKEISEVFQKYCRWRMVQERFRRVPESFREVLREFKGIAVTF